PAHVAVPPRDHAIRFRDRHHAGQVLGWRLVEAGVLERFPESRLVLGLPRGGVPVAGEVARILAAPLDVFLVRKLGVPGHEELAMGAIASGGTRAHDPAAVVVAVPVGSPDTCRELSADADEVVCVRLPDRFLAVGQAYDDFSPTTDDQVRAVLEALSPVSVKSPHRP